jgi:hypothetical protein
MKQPGFFDLPDHMKRLSDAGDPLETMVRVVNFESFRGLLEASLGLSQPGANPGPNPGPRVGVHLMTQSRCSRY